MVDHRQEKRRENRYWMARDIVEMRSKVGKGGTETKAQDVGRQ